MRPPMPSMLLTRRAKILIAVVVTLIVLIIALVQFSGVYINFLWFDQIGHSNVYSTIFWTRVSLFFIFGVLMALIIGGNLVVAYLLKPPFRPMSPEQQNLQHYVVMVEPRRKLILAAVSVIALLSAGASAQGDWAKWLLFFNGGSFGIKDPQFGKDISFYAFDYPVYRTLLSFGFTAVIFSIILSAGIHYLTGAIRLQTRGPKITVAARRHLTALVFVFMAFKAVAYWLDRYGLVFSSRSKFTGASYTDVHSELPAKTILFWITIILAVGVLASIWLKSALLPGIGFVALLVVSILIGGIYPAIVQSVSVSPNASDKERPYIERNIIATRQAYGITTQDTATAGTVDYKSYDVAANPSPSELTDTNSTVGNIRILDPNVISPTFTAQQKIGRPYAFNNRLNVDRYTINGVTHDYVVGVREQAVGSNLTGSQNNWINQHTVYTHGYGFVAAQADEDVTNNDQLYTEGGIPPTGPLGLTQPRVYFGQLGNDFSIVGAQGTKREADGNGGDNITYTGKGGVSLSNPFTKLAFALHYKDTNFLLNGAVGDKGAKIIYVRDPKQRLEKVAPFLTVDGSPYPIVDKATGHIVWMLDGYTTMSDYPYSERQSLSDLTHTSLQQGQADTQINYIRNSVKATVDAYDGTVHIYDWDSTDPILKAWTKIFPNLVLPKSDMPQDIRDHVRYPQDFFDVQRSLIAQYHITNPQDAYNGKGTWAVPGDPFVTGDQPPYYVLARPAADLNDDTAQFQLTSPMVVNNSNNLAAYISAETSYSGGNKITVLQVPGKSSFLGPGQVANDLKSTPVISRDINQFNQSQTNIDHGNLLTLPIGNSFLYVEPIYVESSTANSSVFPTLARVFVRYGKAIGYGATLDDALSDIREGNAVGSTLGALGQTNNTTPPAGGSSSTPTASPSSGSSGSTSSSSSPTATPSAGTQAALLQSLSTVQQQLAKAMTDGDFNRYAALQAEQNKLVKQLLALSSASPTGSRSTSPTPRPTPS